MTSPESERTVETLAMFWAHYDDDLVFANPALLKALDDGSRVRSFFATASDAGAGMGDYVAGRETGIRAAYDAMRGESGPWADWQVVLPNGVALTVTSPVGDDRIALSFLRLPDGGTHGNGYPATGRQSLPKLLSGELPSLTTLDNGQTITVELLESTIAQLFAAAEATSVISLYPGFDDPDGDDHPDHQTIGRVVAGVVEAGGIPADLIRYAIGYPGSRLPANIEPVDLTRKLEAFAAYGGHDPVVARAQVEDYLTVRGFGEWLQRQYLEPHHHERPRSISPKSSGVPRPV